MTLSYKLIAAVLMRALVWRRKFKHFGDSSIIYSPMMITGPQYIQIGNGTCIRDGIRLETVLSPGSTWTPSLIIGNNVNIEQGAHIVCQGEVIIEDNVSITPYCTVVDTYHPFDPPDGPIKIGSRLPKENTFVRIGAGSFIGAHSIILPNVTIGKGCVIGAGAVVACDIPDYSVAIGVPAKVVRQFDPDTRKWRNFRSEPSDS